MEGLPGASGAPAMAKRRWKVDWRAEPKSDGLERLGQAVKLAIDHAAGTREARGNKNGALAELVLHTSSEALEELDA
jgi:hypothetical protein